MTTTKVTKYLTMVIYTFVETRKDVMKEVAYPEKTMLGF